ncbi:MAG: MotA/TolQ/ExbB proton channel family protein [Myxococcota bacterium]|nr:MotA/TolQ/ExbB proton channel family protein [Myxococcota bacterium]
MLMSAIEQLGEYIAGGGFVMPPLVGAAALLWYVLGYRLFTLRRGSSEPLSRLLSSNEEAASKRGIIVRSIPMGRAALSTSPERPRVALDLAFSKLDDELARFDTLVVAIVAAAPLAGLLGTVAGMMETFDALADMALFSQSGGIAGGISQALLTTQMGLAVAIPGLLIGRLLKRRQDRLSEELEQVKDLLCLEQES